MPNYPIGAGWAACDDRVLLPTGGRRAVHPYIDCLNILDKEWEDTAAGLPYAQAQGIAETREVAAI
jgi:hypothetical protein